MWIFATKGFVSIVEDNKDPAMLLVRGRFAGDIEAVLPGYPVKLTRDADYRYRASIPRVHAAQRIAELITKIDYPNFKNAAPASRHGVYLNVWTAMIREQERLARPKKRKRGKKNKFRDSPRYYHSYFGDEGDDVRGIWYGAADWPLPEDRQ